MTSHGLVRCSPERLLGHATQLHGAVSPDEVGAYPRWRYAEPPADRSACWCTRLPDGSLVAWRLEVEPGANGVLAHLSATLVAGRLARLPGTVQRLALRRWTEHQLMRLARAVEAGSTTAAPGRAAIG
jgi:hypothetical protein